MTRSPRRAAIHDIDSGSFHVSKSGAKLNNIFLLASMTCSNGLEDVGLFIGGIEEPPARLPIAADGAFAGTFSVSPELRNPFAVTEEFRLSGRFIRHGRAVRVTFGSRAVGEAGTTCDSGDLTATGLRQPRKRRA